MKSLDDIYRKMEEERLERMRVQKEAELQQIALYEKQRQYMEEQRRMYEKVGTVAPSSAASNSSSAGAAGAAGAGGGGQIPIPPYTTFSVGLNIDQYQSFNVAYRALDQSNKFVIDFGDGTIERIDGDYDSLVIHQYQTSGNYVVKIPNGAEYLKINSDAELNLPSGLFADSTGLTEVILNPSDPIILEPGVFDNGGALKTITISKITEFKLGVFNNLPSGAYITFALGNSKILTYEDGAFLFGNRPTTIKFISVLYDTGVVDAIITDLYNNNVQNLTTIGFASKVPSGLQYMVDHLNEPANNLNNDIG